MFTYSPLSELRVVQHARGAYLEHWKGLLPQLHEGSQPGSGHVVGGEGVGGHGELREAWWRGAHVWEQYSVVVK